MHQRQSRLCATRKRFHVFAPCAASPRVLASRAGALRRNFHRLDFLPIKSCTICADEID